MATAHRVLIVDPHPIVRGVVRTACEATGTLTVVAEAADLAEATTACEEHEPDLLVIDPDLPGTREFEAVTALREVRPEARMLVLAATVNGTLVLDCLRAKVDGCVAKSAGVGPIAEAIETVASGGRVFPPGFERDAVAALGRFAKAARTQKWASETLTPRELEVLRLLAEGLTIRQAATRAKISPRTVESHVTRLYRKLGVATRVQAIARAASLGLIELGPSDGTGSVGR
ncbi:MAG: response regulator transcription factor [Actinomycetota bacterium]